MLPKIVFKKQVFSKWSKSTINVVKVVATKNGRLLSLHAVVRVRRDVDRTTCNSV